MQLPNVITYNDTLFRQQFPAFANTTTYPQAQLQMYWNNATCYISACNYGLLNNCCRQDALNLLTAHLAASFTIINGGQITGIINKAQIDKINVSLTPPPVENGWQYWLATTPYGIQLWALLQAKAVGGFYVGGFPETNSFRRNFGAFI